MLENQINICIKKSCLPGMTDKQPFIEGQKGGYIKYRPAQFDAPR